MYFDEIYNIIYAENNLTTFRDNPANQKVATILPATTQSGNGHGWIQIIGTGYILRRYR